MSDLAWLDDAICRQSDGDAWFPPRGESPRPAKAICRRCPVIAKCLDYALANDLRFGVYGGRTDRERQALKREQRKEAA